jgi:hypothetical protein
VVIDPGQLNGGLIDPAGRKEMNMKRSGNGMWTWMMG